MSQGAFCTGRTRKGSLIGAGIANNGAWEHSVLSLGPEPQEVEAQPIECDTHASLAGVSRSNRLVIGQSEETLQSAAICATVALL